MKYGLATPRLRETMDRKVQQFASRCIGEIIYPKHERQEDEDIQHRAANGANGTKYPPANHTLAIKQRTNM